jgi:phosphoribosyl-AMP cyclohydrolase
MWTTKTPFAPPGSKSELEEGAVLSPKFDGNGLITAVVTDAGTKEVLMLAHMNAQALALCIETGNAWYFSRSRNTLWRKGETSGNTQKIVEMRVDCDQDAVWISVQQKGPACHTERKSCFYRSVEIGAMRPELVKR